MSIKLTKRKAFNFFRSYFDVFNELPEKDKLPFIEALLNKQFLGVEPEKLKGISKFAYLSQKHSIDTQVKGFEDKTGFKLCNNNKVKPPTEAPSTPPIEPPSVQEKGKGEEEGKEKEEVNTPFFNHEVKLEYFEKWIKYRIEIKKLIKSKSTINGLIEKFNKENVDEVIFAVNNSINNGWVGLFWDKNIDKSKDKPKTLQDKFKHLM